MWPIFTRSKFGDHFPHLTTSPRNNVEAHGSELRVAIIFTRRTEPRYVKKGRVHVSPDWGRRAPRCTAFWRCITRWYPVSPVTCHNATEEVFRRSKWRSLRRNYTPRLHMTSTQILVHMMLFPDFSTKVTRG